MEKKEKDAKMDKDFVEVGKDEYDPAEMYPIKDELNSETSIKFEEVRLGHWLIDILFHTSVRILS